MVNAGILAESTTENSRHELTQKIAAREAWPRPLPESGAAYHPPGWPHSTPILLERGLRFAPPRSQLSGTPVKTCGDRV